MKVIFAEQQRKHAPKIFISNGAPQPNPETPERADRLLEAALRAGLALEEPADCGLGPIAAVHTPEYLAFLENIWVRWQRIPGASEDVLPNVHPDRRDCGYPASAVGQVGYHMYDGDCPISADTWEAVRWSAATAVHAARAVANGAAACYALSRPPGHHASKDLAGGFCYLNNAAIAAEVLRGAYARVAVLDVDVHHGNGTQAIFYERPDVLTVSLHADPTRFYPFFWGYASERGTGPGLGYNLNVPLPRGTGDEDYLKALDRAVLRIRSFDPGALVVALGLDAYAGDPFKGMSVTTAGFGGIGGTIAALGLPTVIVQEGGYLSDALGANLESFLSAFLDTHTLA
ncbi:MAG TPA: histone deacetylase family protein [Woeseiaceae bacterium]|nr:histone deacetylase family protein [Woeseiaceae bacterium]